ncbi:succinate dehydrogenase, hydrophobic membrane anchor protein [Coxiella endosymbiont of Amblyomma sculptum]|uniref:succinate dehydrogenase, hydrophobic membrane anchor protein n=1 Tax=Coxiella endosymbiont of Amblyomma sculptum TaxID=2487929 RepID=UPI00132EFC6E|nr:succinate dehydrogenase, hydrophobic membrane anchor protein [Coxiella endosymbiont of Amblyomma sculptum]QHG92679.1 succinate dehydrogenase, hydrophobic membrane anchor protein [Coxiella endosymbiont of Amblyomma sculptum]
MGIVNQQKMSRCLGYNSWCVQRITALLIGAYTVFLIVFLLIQKPVSYKKWCILFAHIPVKIFTLLTIFSILWHAWIGVWIILTDYVKNSLVRSTLETTVFLVLFACFVIWTVKFFQIV